MRLCSRCKTEYENKFSSYCSPCTSAYHKERYVKKKDELLLKQKLYILKNQQAVQERNRIYKENNKDFVRSLTESWRKANKAKVNAANKARRFAIKKAAPKWLTEEDFWMIEQAYELAQLRTKMLGISFHVDHILPIKGKTVCGLHTPNNLQVIPALENMRKGNKCFLIT